jgi:hypothetical protein
MEHEHLQHFLNETPLLDFHNASFYTLNENHRWDKLPDTEKIQQIYEFVRDNIAYQFPKKRIQTASGILADGWGFSLSKSILLMALLRLVHIPCRFHGFLIKKEFLKGIPDDKLYRKIPELLVHGWVEALKDDHWIILEGATLPEKFIQKQLDKIPVKKGEYNGYGLGVHELENLLYRWTGKHTYIQRNAILRDFSVFNNPDDFLSLFGKELKSLRKYYPARRHIRKLNKMMDI